VLTITLRYGISVGPFLTSGWDSSWTTSPVIYDPTVAGDFCLALPGGMVAKDMINQAAAKCPNSKLFLSGYSQGAMVVRNGIAYANDSAKKNIKVLYFLSSLITPLGPSPFLFLQWNKPKRRSQAMLTKPQGVITFGDPFQGAPIKGYDGPIKIFCKIDDGVCGGNFELSTAHLSYPMDTSVAEAKALLKKWAAGA
jgi:cutinase